MDILDAIGTFVELDVLQQYFYVEEGARVVVLDASSSGEIASFKVQFPLSFLFFLNLWNVINKGFPFLFLEMVLCQPYYPFLI